MEDASGLAGPHLQAEQSLGTLLAKHLCGALLPAKAVTVLPGRAGRQSFVFRKILNIVSCGLICFMNLLLFLKGGRQWV